MSDRINLGKLKEIIPPLDLLGLQLNSYKEFLQQYVPPSERKKVGLEAIFQDFFPIEDYDNKYRLEYVSYRWGDVTGDYCDCIRNGTTYGTSLYLTLRLMSDNKQVQEGEVYLGEFPLMTERASFVVNGAERVVVSQLHRSPGISFDQEWHPSGKRLFPIAVFGWKFSLMRTICCTFIWIVAVVVIGSLLRRFCAPSASGRTRRF